MKKIIESMARVIVSIYSLRMATKIIKGNKSINDVPERFRECVKKAIKIQINDE